MGNRASKRVDEAIARSEEKGLLYHPDSESARRSCRRRVASGTLVEPFPGLFARKAHWGHVKPWVRPYQLVRSLASVHPEWVFTSFSAACMYGIPVSMDLLERVHVVKPKGSHSGWDGTVVRHAMDADGCRYVMGVRVTSLDRTVVDCLRAAPFPDALAIADGALRVGDWSQARLTREVERHAAHCPGVVHARRVAQYADARAESGGESVARGVMIEEGFAVPDLQTVLPNILDPSSPFRVDGSWKTPDGRLIVFENDGEEKYKMFSSSHGAGAVRRMMRERQRESLLTAACDALIRFDYHTVKTPGALARLLDSYGVPRVRS